MIGSLVLLPTYNEKENLPRVLERLSRLSAVDVLVIDDASPDGSGELAERLRSRFARLGVLHRKEKEGLGPAYVHGFKEALRRGYRRIITMDADLSHSPEDVPRLLEALERADVAVGSRHVRGGGVERWPLSRRLLSRSGSFYARTLLGLSVRDVTSGFRAYRSEALEELDLEEIDSRGFIFQVEILKRILERPGRGALEVPIVFRNRTHGRSKLSFSIISEGAFEVLSLFKRHKEGKPKALLAQKLPFVSVVIAARPETQPLSAGASALLSYPKEKLEVVIAWGRCPSRQRNKAVGRSSGEYLLFLDDDSEVSEGLLLRHVDALRDPEVAAAGGPALSRPRGYLSELFSLLLSETWVVGRTASRYRARGRRRGSEERELILCNLLVRRKAFEAAGGFDERLYPNEENELLERLRTRGWKLTYDPEAQVSRPGRRGLGEFLKAVYRYGRGRGRQVRLFPSSLALGRAALALGALFAGAAAVLGALGGSFLLALLLLFFGGWYLLLAAKLTWRGGLRRGAPAAALSFFLHLAYATGVVRGLLLRPRAVTQREVTVERYPAVEEKSPISASSTVTSTERKRA